MPFYLVEDERGGDYDHMTRMVVRAEDEQDALTTAYHEGTTSGPSNLYGWTKTASLAVERIPDEGPSEEILSHVTYG